MAKSKKTKIITGLACAMPAILTGSSLAIALTGCSAKTGNSHIEFSGSTKKTDAVPYFEKEMTYTFLLKNVADASQVQISLPTLKIDGNEVGDNDKFDMYESNVSANGNVTITFDLERIKQYANEHSNSSVYSNVVVNFSIKMADSSFAETIDGMKLTLAVYDYAVTYKATNCTITSDQARALYGRDFVATVKPDSYYEILPENVKVSISGLSGPQLAGAWSFDPISKQVVIKGDYIFGPIEITCEATLIKYNVDTTGVDSRITINGLGSTITHAKEDYVFDVTINDTEGTGKYVDPATVKITSNGKDIANARFEYDDDYKCSLVIPGEGVVGDVVIKAGLNTVLKPVEFKNDGTLSSKIALNGLIASAAEYGYFIEGIDLTGTIKPKTGYFVKDLAIKKAPTEAIAKEPDKTNWVRLTNDEYSYDYTSGELTIPWTTLHENCWGLYFEITPQIYTFDWTARKSSSDPGIVSLTTSSGSVDYGNQIDVDKIVVNNGYKIDPKKQLVRIGNDVIDNQYITVALGDVRANDHDEKLTIAKEILDHYPTGGIVTIDLISSARTYNVVPVSAPNITYTGKTGPDAATHGVDYTLTIKASEYYDVKNIVIKQELLSGEVKTLTESEYTYNALTGLLTIPGANVLGNMTISAQAVPQQFDVNITYDLHSTYVTQPDPKATYLTNYTAEFKTTADTYVLERPVVTCAVGGDITGKCIWENNKLTINGGDIKGAISINVTSTPKKFQYTLPKVENYIKSAALYDETGTVAPVVTVEGKYKVVIDVAKYTTPTFTTKVGGATKALTFTKTVEISQDVERYEAEIPAGFVTGEVVISANVVEDAFNVTLPKTEGEGGATGLQLVEGKTVTNHFSTYTCALTTHTHYSLNTDVDSSTWDVVLKSDPTTSVKKTWGCKLTENDNTYTLAVPAPVADFEIKVTPAPRVYTVELDAVAKQAGMTITSAAKPTYHQEFVVSLNVPYGTLTKGDILIYQIVSGSPELIPGPGTSVPKWDVVIDDGTKSAVITVEANVIEGPVIIYAMPSTTSVLAGELNDETNITFTSLPARPIIKQDINATYAINNDKYLYNKFVKIGDKTLTYGKHYSFANGKLYIPGEEIDDTVTISGQFSPTTLKYSTTGAKDLLGLLDSTIDSDSINDEFKTSFTIGADVTGVADNAFYNTSTQLSTLVELKAETLDVATGSGLALVGQNAFRGSKFKEISFAKVDSNIQTIKPYAFADCVNLEKLTLGNTATNLVDANCMIEGCDNINTIYIDVDFGDKELKDTVSATIFQGLPNRSSTTKGTIYVKKNWSAKWVDFITNYCTISLSDLNWQVVEIEE